MRTLTRLGVIAACLLAPLAARSGDGPAIGIDNFTFAPGTLTIAPGTEVTWTNHDDIPHSIVVTGTSIRSKALDTDQTFAWRFDQAGTFTYICGLHPQMHGQIVVK